LHPCKIDFKLMKKLHAFLTFLLMNSIAAVQTAMNGYYVSRYIQLLILDSSL